jgi:hypothetical protein
MGPLNQCQLGGRTTFVIARCTVARAKAGPYAHALFALPPRSRGSVELVSHEPLLNLGIFRIIVGDFRANLAGDSSGWERGDEAQR